MRLLIALLTIAFSFGQVSVAQESYAYGVPTDLKGLKRIYIDTGPDTKNRDHIIKDLRESKLDFDVVDDEKDAEILLGYGAGEVTRKVIASVSGPTVVAREKTQRTGTGVVVAINARGKDRLVLSFKDVQNSKWERNPVTNFTREFIKAYKKGNNVK